MTPPPRRRGCCCVLIVTFTRRIHLFTSFDLSETTGNYHKSYLLMSRSMLQYVVVAVELSAVSGCSTHENTTRTKTNSLTCSAQPFATTINRSTCMRTIFTCRHEATSHPAQASIHPPPRPPQIYAFNLCRSLLAQNRKGPCSTCIIYKYNHCMILEYLLYCIFSLSATLCMRPRHPPNYMIYVTKRRRTPRRRRDDSAMLTCMEGIAT